MKEKWIGWWIITTTDGRTLAADRYEGDTYEEALKDAVATFGAGTTVKAS